MTGIMQERIIAASLLAHVSQEKISSPVIYIIRNVKNGGMYAVSLNVYRPFKNKIGEIKPEGRHKCPVGSEIPYSPGLIQNFIRKGMA
jgi:hypothetical protein